MSIFSQGFAFIAWVPFALHDDCLQFVNTTNKKAIIKVKRSTMMKDKTNKITNKQEYTTSAVRGFSTIQRISIKQLNVQKEIMLDCKNERTIIGLSIEVSAVAAQLEAAENCAVL